MQLNPDSSFSPTHKHRLSPQMSRSHTDINTSKGGNGQQISINTRKIDLHLIKTKISDVQKMLKTREREFLSPRQLRGSFGTNNPEPKHLKQNFLSPNAEKNRDSKPLDQEQLRTSWSDHQVNMLEESKHLKDDKNATISPKKLTSKINQTDVRANDRERKYRIIEENSAKSNHCQNLLEIPKIEGMRQKDESQSKEYRFSFQTNYSGALQLQKKMRTGNNKNISQFAEENRKDEKVRLHINRTQEVLELIKKDPLQKIKEQKRSGIMDCSKKVLCGFQFGRALGKGKFGHVYIARHIQTGFVAAIKKIEKAKIRQFNMINQFIKEIKLHNSLDHPKIVKFYGFFEQQREIYLVLEYMNGGTLFEYLNKVGFLSIKETVDFLRDIILAITYLHERSIAHRDIKPQNIVISTEGVAKLCDFGWSSVIDSMRNTYCGTLDYASPQILQRKEYDLSVDIWSIGILAFEMLMGKAPFQDKNRSLVRQKILNVDKMEFNYARNIPDQAKEFIESLVQKDPAKRPKITELLNFKLFANFGSKTAKKT